MITCPHCGYENPDQQVICLRCSLPLSLNSEAADAEEKSSSATRLFKQAPREANVPRWGTASLGSERKLLLYIRGYDTPLVVPLREELLLGRFDTENDQLPDVSLDHYDGADMGVSRRHAKILVDDDGLKVMDLDSANFTYINGQRLVARQARILRDGDELRLGRLVMRVTFA